MKKIAILIFLLSQPWTFADPAMSQEEQEVLQSVNTLIDSWKKTDVAKAESVLHPDFRLLSLHYQEKDAKVGMNTRDELVKVMKNIKAGEWDDRLKDPKVTFSKTGIANVWTEYQFYVDGKLSHCGIESFQLYKMPEGWQIINFADTHGSCPL